MRTSFEPGAETLRIPFGTPKPIPFHDRELDLDLAVRARGFAEAVPAPGADRDEWTREIRAAAFHALRAQLESSLWTWSDLEKRREALEEAMEETLAGEGRRLALRFADIVPDEASEKAIREKRAPLTARLPAAPVDSPMDDGPGAWPPTGGGFGLCRVGETPPPPAPRACPQCGRTAPSWANFCPQCGAKKPR